MKLFGNGIKNDFFRSFFVMISKRSLWVEVPLVILSSIYIVLNITVLSHAFDEEQIDKFLILWIYCALAAITVFLLMLYFATHSVTTNNKRLLFVLSIFFTNFGIVCEFFANTQFEFLNVLFQITFGISFVCFVTALILTLIYCCSQQKMNLVTDLN